MKSEDFEKEFCNYFNNFKESPESDTWLNMHQARRFARHFMKWQKEQDERLINLAKDSWYKEGFVKGQIEGLSEEEKYQQGRFDEREQMMNYVQGKYDAYQEEYDDYYAGLRVAYGNMLKKLKED